MLLNGRRGSVKLAPFDGAQDKLDWLCFPGFPNGVYFHNLLSNKTLRHLSPAKIGFVFFKSLSIRHGFTPINTVV